MTEAALERACALVAKGDIAGCVNELLATWQRTRSPRIADLIDLVTTRISLSDYPQGEEWFEVARANRPEDLPRLLCSASSGSYIEKVQAIAFRDDPRLASKLPGRFFTLGGAWTTIFEILLRLGDIRAADLLEELVANRGDPDRRDMSFRELIEGTVAMLRAQPAPASLSAAAEASCRQIEAELARPHARGTSRDTREEQLLIAIAENLDDDDVRLIYADWLLERDDPRGEFIQLQIQSGRHQPTSMQREREENLLEAGKDLWAGALSRGARADRYERGFPTVFHLTSSDLEPLIGHAGWATIRQLWFRSAECANLGPFINHSVFRSLTSIGLHARYPRELSPLVATGIGERVQRLEVDPMGGGDVGEIHLEDWVVEVERSPFAQLDIEDFTFTRDVAGGLSIVHIKRLQWWDEVSDVIESLEQLPQDAITQCSMDRSIEPSRTELDRLLSRFPRLERTK
jgi:uncharacterized protein (TIGR02996 family)